MKERTEVNMGGQDDRDPIKVHLTNVRDMKLEAKGSGIMKGDQKSIIILMTLVGTYFNSFQVLILSISIPHKLHKELKK